MGWTSRAIQAQIDAMRWRRFGRAILLHNGAPTEEERHRIVLLNCGPRSVWTAFTALQFAGLTGWERETTHVLVPCGSRPVRLPGMPMRVHFTGAWDPAEHLAVRRLHRPADALLVAAATFHTARPACGIVCAGVQQRLVTAAMLRAAFERRPRMRHHAVLRYAIDDIEQGAQALSEIDFATLCRRHGLPTPVRQAIRTDGRGRRRYLDSEWVRRDGRRVVAEVDGALHLVPARWWDDQLRQNELVVAGSLVLRFPSVIVRTEPELVAAQLGAALTT